MIDIMCPIRAAGIGTAAESGEEIEFQVVVRIDQAREKEIVAEVEGGGVLRWRFMDHTADPACGDFDIGRDGGVRVERDVAADEI